MDAWLRPYSNDPDGNSIIMVRNREINKLLQLELKSQNVTLSEIDYDRVVHSQVGGLKFKKGDFIEKIGFFLNKEFSNTTFRFFSKNEGIKSFLMRFHLKVFR